MGISKLFKEKSGAPGGDKPAAGQDNVANEANFEDEHGNWVLTEAEAWKLAAALAAAKNEEEFQAALSGILAGRIFENYFDKNEINQKTAREKDQKARADMYYIAILQAQIDALDAQIDALYQQRDSELTKYLSQSDIDAINALPREDQDKALRDLMAKKLKNGEITQDQHDAWLAWYDDWSADLADRVDKRNQVADAILRANGKDLHEVREVVQSEIERTDGATVHAAALKNLGHDQRETVNQAIDENKRDGNVTLKNSNADFGAITVGGNALSGGTSMASALTGGSALAGKTPPVKSAFVQATGPVEQTALALQPENDKPQDPAHGGPPVGLG